VEELDGDGNPNEGQSGGIRRQELGQGNAQDDDENVRSNRGIPKVLISGPKR
jgi:hypothetical protein